MRIKKQIKRVKEVYSIKENKQDWENIGAKEKDVLYKSHIHKL